MSGRAALANAAWLGSNLPAWWRYRRALDDIARVQWTLLARYLRRNASTAFGQAHGFERIRSMEEFRARVPLSSYDDLEPFIERVLQGEDRVLTSERVRLLDPSSGSTRAAKLIPYTRSLQREFRRAVAPWMAELVRTRPHLLGGRAYWSVTPDTQRAYPATRRPIGFDSDAAYLGGRLEPVVNATLAVPPAARRIRDLPLLRRVTALCLLAAPDLRLISVWHPSYLTLLIATMREQWDGLVRDIARGYRHQDPPITIPPDPARARSLAALRGDELAAAWPKLGLISCWGDGYARTYLPEIETLFPHVEIQAKGLLATEAVVSIPFAGTWPLAVTSHVFEFLDARGRALRPHETTVGTTYSVVVTTGGGLYRYRLHDLVEVTGVVGQTPCLRFLGKEDHVSDLAGEKLSEGFVNTVLTRLLARHGIRPPFALLAPEAALDPPGYVLYVAMADDPAATLAADLDAALRENPHYDHCTRLGQLGPARVARVPADAYERYVSRLHAEGRRVGAVKPTPLSARSGWARTFGVDRDTAGAPEHAVI